MVVGIIGAGASGMAAALAAAENPNVQVLLVERQARVGRKLQATGNGRCNLTNLNAGAGGYYGDNPAFSAPALTAFDPEATLRWFASLGLLTVAEPSGRVYPYSDQANSVVDVLRLNLVKPNIRLVTGFEVEKIVKRGEDFALVSADQTLTCQKLIVACGGLAGTKLGGSMSGYKLLNKLGHKSTRLRPALVQLKCGWDGVVSLKGVRCNCQVQILRDGALFAQSSGELQFTEYGLSGPVIFEVSRDVCHGTGEFRAVLDFLPQYSSQMLIREMQRRTRTQLPIEELLTGILHNRLGRVLTRAAGIKSARFVKELSSLDLEEICRVIKGFEVPLTDTMGMDSAQVTAGGVETAGFDSETMESKLVKGLYACGEVLDVDGACGGYNLQWAWSSGRCAGLHAGREQK